MRFRLLFGVPIKKQNYNFPVYRAIESEIYRANIFKYFQVYTGGDFAPNYFVNIPSFGKDFQVFENDIFWFKLGFGMRYQFNGKEFSFRLNYLKSLMTSSNQKFTYSGDRVNTSFEFPFTQTQSLELTYQKTSLVGDVGVKSDGLLISYFYKFEN